MLRSLAGRRLWRSRLVHTRVRQMSVAVEELLMPALSPTMEEGNISKWNVKEGQFVGPGEVFCSVETDKATVDFESTDDCVVAKILLSDGAEGVAVGSVIGYTVEDEDEYKAFVDGGSVIPEASTAPAAAAPAPAAAPMAAAAEDASAHGTRVPLIKFRGKRSLEAHPPKPAAAPLAAAATPAADASLVTGAVAGAGDYEDIVNSNMRKVIAKRLGENKRNVPHQYATIACEVDTINELRKHAKDELGVKISVNDFVVRAAALALRDVPEVNTYWDDAAQAAAASPSVDVCVAVATDGGLITPIIFGTDGMGLSAIHDEVGALAKKAREGSLQPHEFMGGSFTISNLGMFGVSEFSAIINAPGQGAILAVGTGVRQFVYPTLRYLKFVYQFVYPTLSEVEQIVMGGDLDNEEVSKAAAEVRVATLMSLTLSYDTRAVSAQAAGQFMQVLKHYLDSPKQLMF